MKSERNLAVVGATGLVGREMLKILEERSFGVKGIRLFASGRSAGSTYPFRGSHVPVENLADADFTGTDVVLASAGAAVSRQFAPRAVAAGAVVIDNTSAFRMDPEVPLVVPEVNAFEIARHRGIIANPNCTTIQLVVALAPLHAAFGLRRVVVSTYQAVSGAGRKGIEELTRQCMALLSGRPVDIDVFPHQIAFNVLPHIDRFEEDGFTCEEHKVMSETRKILGLPDLAITATTVRVPVLNGHSESVNVTFDREPDLDEVRAVLERASGVVVEDEPMDATYPMALGISGRDEVFVGRIRRDPSAPNSLHLWVVADNLRKGAALNAVQIAEHLP